MKENRELSPREERVQKASLLETIERLRSAHEDLAEGMEEDIIRQESQLDELWQEIKLMDERANALRLEIAESEAAEKDTSVRYNEILSEVMKMFRLSDPVGKKQIAAMIVDEMEDRSSCTGDGVDINGITSE